MNPEKKIVDVYFPLNGMVSLLGILEDGTTIETAMVGREGMLGISAILGSGHHNQCNRVTLDGTAVRVEAKLIGRYSLRTRLR